MLNINTVLLNLITSGEILMPKLTSQFILLSDLHWVDKKLYSFIKSQNHALMFYRSDFSLGLSPP